MNEERIRDMSREKGSERGSNKREEGRRREATRGQ